MKIKFKPAYAGLLLIAIMLFSSVAYGFLQSITFSPQKESKIELPKESIIDYELSREQENELIKNGITLMKFNYTLTCSNCLEEKNFLEQITTVSQFKNQIILQENLVKTELVNPILVIKSSYGQKSLTGFDVNKTIDALCDLVVKQPYECVLRKVG